MKENKVLNELLVKSFKNITKIEEMVLNENEVTKKLTMQEIHTIECIGAGEHSLLADMANDLRITLGTLSVALTKLMAKGYIIKQRDEDDKRVLKITLTEKGKKVYEVHEKFHKEFVNYAIGFLEQDEVEGIILFLERVNDFFISKYSNVKTGE